MRNKTFISSMVGVAAVVAVAGSANASVLSFNVNWGPNGPSADAIVGIAVKVDAGRASVLSITGADSGSSYALPAGWSQQTLAASFLAGTNPSANTSQYGFVRGGGGATFSTAATYGGTGPSPLGFKGSFALDAGPGPIVGDTVNILWTTFRNNGALDVQAKYTFTFGSGGWTGASTVGPFWSQVDSGTFNELSAAVVPAPGALALLGVAGLAGGRRRRA